MRNLMLSLLMLFVTVSGLSATEVRPADDLRPEVVPSVVAEVEPGPEAAIHVTEVTLEERAAPADDAAAQLGPRGGFWWVVGVIVVAGVILAILL